MKIKKMTATFGKLKNQEMQLGPGLNIVNAPNEYGKSTWCAFIKAMLYGINTSERDRAGHLSDKTRFRPWDGSTMAGTMELTKDGRDITIQRTSKGSAPFKNLLAVYTGTADFIRDLNSETAGETLTGVSEHVFERTAYIRRPELRVSQTSDLEKRISSLVISGDEQSSYSESDALLRAWQRKIKYNRSGTLPALEAQLREAEAKLEQLNKNADELAGLRSAISRLQAQRDNLKADLETHEKLEKRSTARRIRDMQAKAASYEQQVNELSASITRNGHRMTREDINDIRETASSISPLRKVRNDAEKALMQAEKGLSEIEAKRDASPLSGMTEEEAGKLTRHAMELKESADKAKKRKLPKIVPVLMIAVGAVLLLMFSGILAPFGKWIQLASKLLSFEFNIIGLIIGLVLMAAGVFFSFYTPSGSAYETELNGIFSKYGVPSIEKLSALVNAYSVLCRQVLPATSVRDSARQSYQKASNDLEEAEKRAVSQIAEFMPEVTSGQDVIDALNRTEETLEKLTKAEFDMISCRNVYETLISGYEGDPDADDTYLPVPLRSKEDTAAALERANAQLSEAVHNFDLASGAQYSLSDPAVVEGEIQSLNERISQDLRRYDALSMAIDTLSDANTELQTRFSPLISKKASEIMTELTNGKYERIAFDKGFDASTKTADDTATHNVISLSDGTVDEIYFSLRLAMCELILNGDDPCPIILDDALLNFDDERCKAALDMLLKLSRERQIILFSCHSREAEFLSGCDEVNII